MLILTTYQLQEEKQLSSWQPSIRVVSIGDDLEPLNHAPVVDVVDVAVNEITLQELAYICYTSGSTGLYK